MCITITFVKPSTLVTGNLFTVGFLADISDMLSFLVLIQSCCFLVPGSGYETGSLWDGRQPSGLRPVPHVASHPSPAAATTLSATLLRYDSGKRDGPFLLLVWGSKFQNELDRNNPYFRGNSHDPGAPFSSRYLYEESDVWSDPQKTSNTRSLKVLSAGGTSLLTHQIQSFQKRNIVSIPLLLLSFSDFFSYI